MTAPIALPLRRLRGWRVAAAALAGWLLVSAATPLLAQTFNEYQLKAVFLLRFTQFVEWPDAVAKSSAPFAICVLGSDPFAGYLEDAVRGESIHQRPIVVRHYQKPAAAQECGIAFISDSERGQMKDLAAALRERGVLTVGDSFDFASQGGMIELVTADNRIRLKINVDAARAANLQLSSKLLRPATIVRDRG